MTFTITASRDSVPVPSGTYKATLESVEVKQLEVPSKFGTSEFRVWNFLADVNGELLPVSGSSSVNTGTKTKAYEWLTAIVGEAPTVGTTIDPIGNQCMVEVGQKDGYPQVIAVKPYSAPDTVLEGVPR